MSVQSADDTDSSVSYSGSWTTSEDPSEIYVGSVYQGTLHSTTEPGASATFSFQGYNAVGAILVIPACSGNVVGSWTIDGQTGKVGIPCTSSIQANRSFYPYTACSSFGPHSLVVRNSGTVAFQLDRFIFGNITTNTPSSSTPVMPPGDTTMTTTSSISTTATTSSRSGTSTAPNSQGTSHSSNSSNSTVATGAATALNAGSPGASSVSRLEYTATGVSSSGVLTSTDVSDSTTSPSPSSPSLGPIIGGALGALALVLLFILLLLKCRPWRRGKSDMVETLPSSIPTPFNVQERLTGQIGFDDKTAPAIAEPSHQLPSTATPNQSSPIQSPRFDSDIKHHPTVDPIRISQENGLLNPASPTTPTPENRQSLAPSYSPDPNRPNFQSGFSNGSANRASALTDVPPAYDNIPPRSSQTQPIL